MLYSIVAILCGIFLLSDFFPKLAGSLKPIEAFMGLVALILGIMSFMGGVSLINVTLILAGIILAVGLLPALKKTASALAPLRTVLGIIALVVGIMGIFF